MMTGIARKDASPEGLEAYRRQEARRLAELVFEDLVASIYLNSDSPALGGCPIDIAAASDEGLVLVEDRLFCLALQQTTFMKTKS